jgi:A/G-specific adenine glycosylase
LLGGTLELPGSPWRVGDLDGVSPDEAPFAAGWTRLPAVVEHGFTHFTLRLALFRAAAPETAAPEGMAFVAPEEIDAAGFSGLMRKAARTAWAAGNGRRAEARRHDP